MGNKGEEREGERKGKERKGIREDRDQICPFQSPNPADTHDVSKDFHGFLLPRT